MAFVVGLRSELLLLLVYGSVISKESPNIYKKWPKTDLTRKMKDFDTFIKLPKMWQFGQKIVATGFEKLPKVQ